MRCSHMLSVVVLCLSYIATSNFVYGKCDDIPVKDSIDISKYTGKWYEIEKTPVIFEYGLKCVTATYENKGDYVSVTNEGVDEKTGNVNNIVGKATIPDINVPAKLEVVFQAPIKANYWVLDTDYENYSLVYSCFSPLRVFKFETVWILSRGKELDDTTKEKLYKILDDNKINRSGLTKTTQDCDN